MPEQRPSETKLPPKPTRQQQQPSRVESSSSEDGSIIMRALRRIPFPLFIIETQMLYLRQAECLSFNDDCAPGA